MNPAQFEEKEYENALYNQLERGDTQWSPGQVLEQYLGFDRALFLSRDYLWNLHGFPGPLGGIRPFDDLWPLMRRRPSSRDRLPSFDLNCFIQAKRPYIGRRRPAKLASLGIGRPFFKFLTEPEQQLCLDAAANRLADRALFVYAAPLFGTSRELFGHMTAGTVVEQSTFPSTALLSGHGAWYYSQPGAIGVRNPDFTNAELPSLYARIAELRERRSRRSGDGQTQSVNLRSLSDELRTVIRENPNIGATARAAYLSEEWYRIEAFARETDAPPALTSFLQISAFARFFNLFWLVIDDAA